MLNQVADSWTTSIGLDNMAVVSGCDGDTNSGMEGNTSTNEATASKAEESSVMHRDQVDSDSSSGDKQKVSGIDGVASANEATASEVKAETENSKSKGYEKSKKVPLYKLFSFADSIDTALMIFGTIGAIANGQGMPISTILFGSLINSFGSNQSDDKHVVHEVSKVIHDA